MNKVIVLPFLSILIFVPFILPTLMSDPPTINAGRTLKEMSLVHAEKCDKMNNEIQFINGIADNMDNLEKVGKSFHDANKERFLLLFIGNTLVQLILIFFLQRKPKERHNK